MGMGLLTLDKDNIRDATLYRRVHAEQYQLALRYLRKEIEDPAFRPLEIHIQTVAWIGAQAPQVIREGQEPYPLSPVRDILELQKKAAALEVSLTHVNAMYHMINMIGGFSAIKQKPLADILQVYEFS